MGCSPPGFSVHGIFQARILELGCHFLLQWIFLTQRLNPGLPHCRQMLYHLSHQGSPQWPKVKPIYDFSWGQWWMVSAVSVILLVSLLTTCEVANGSTWSCWSQDTLIHMPDIDTGWSLPSGLSGKEFSCQVGDVTLIPGQEYTLEKKMATNSSILAWEIPWTEESGGPKSMGSQKELDWT